MPTLAVEPRRLPFQRLSAGVSHSSGRAQVSPVLAVEYLPF
jgi:hypothetical protein